ncbi:MAG: hypothetical protein COW85_05580 [Ignavibacteria bacterium CG22_combo_CG10-13_8_21_14_all_37_15]|nr:MAG: hypothetical protein COW85_05580 [Ignavibacteria bacterium CG22_combo_CG10-13_8_21_14_all_37_15]
MFDLWRKELNMKKMIFAELARLRRGSIKNYWLRVVLDVISTHRYISQLIKVTFVEKELYLYIVSVQ